MKTIWAGRLSDRETAVVARESYRNLAVTMLEQGKMRRMGRERFLSLIDYQPEQIELLHGLVKRGRGVLYASAHFGNWEMLAEFGARLGLNMSVLYKPPTNPYLDRFLHRIRGSNSLIDINSDLSSVVRRLRRGEEIALLFDENARRRGIRIPFFGFEASTYRGPAYFSLRAGAPIVCLYFLRLRDGRHRFLIERVIEPVRSARLDQDIRRIMLEMNQSLEKVILANPGQWNWPYRRWGRNPVPVGEGERD